MEIVFDHERLQRYLTVTGIALPTFAKQLAMPIEELETVLAGNSKCGVGLYARMCLLLHVPYDFFLREDKM